MEFLEFFNFSELRYYSVQCLFLSLEGSESASMARTSCSVCRTYFIMTPESIVRCPSKLCFQTEFLSSFMDIN